MSTLFRNEESRTAPAQRILSLWFPYFSIERIMRQRLGRSWRSGPQTLRAPLVTSRRERNTDRIAALDAQAEALQLKPGTGIADARAMYPTIEIIEDDPEADRRLLESLADWCDRYTPLVAIDGTDGLFLDISGCVHLFGGEKSLLDDILGRFFHQGFDVRVGLASTPGAAWAAARMHGNSMVPPGEEEALLAPLPLWSLRIDPSVAASLESVGLRTVGSIIAAPRAPLSRRFGKLLLVRLDQALGHLEEAVSPRMPVAPLSVERHLMEPVTRTEDIETLVGVLAGSLKKDLERRGEGARRLQLMLFRVDGAVSRVSVGTSRPLRAPDLVSRLFHERLTALEGDIESGCGFDLVRLSVLVAAPFEISQADFSGQAHDETDLALFADRVCARLGQSAVMKSVRAESHLPERAVSMLAFALPTPQNAVSPAKAGEKKTALPAPHAWPERPIRLFHLPEPIDVPVTELPEGPPHHFLWRRTLHRVARAEGPERIAPQWWLEAVFEAEAEEGETMEGARKRAEAARTAGQTRDYFCVEDADGRRYWLYRQGLYGASEQVPRWFIHGVFA